MALINGIHHIALRCADEVEFEKTVQFYQEILGCSFVRAWGEGAKRAVMLDTGAGLMEIFASGKLAENIGTVNHIAFASDDVDKAIEKVRAAGYQITAEPKNIVLASVPPQPARIAFCMGPMGEWIEFFCNL